MRYCSLVFLSVVVAFILAGFSSKSTRAEVKPKPLPHQTTAVTVTCKIFVTAEGSPKSVEVLKVEPSLGPSTRAAFEKAASKMVLTWSFTPNQEGGKSVAGYVVVPVIIDLADPVPVDGT